MTQAHDGPEDDKPMPLLDHLIELRKRLIYALISFFAVFFVTFYFAKPIFSFLIQPALADGYKVVVLDIFEFFFVTVKLSAFVSLIVGFPLIAVQIWLFVAPGLLPAGEARVPAVPRGHAVHVLRRLRDHVLRGAAVRDQFHAHAVRAARHREDPAVVGLPRAHPAAGLRLRLRLRDAGAADPADQGRHHQLRRPAVKRRYAIVICFVVAAVLAPPDVVSQIALAVPLLLFYEISIIVGSWIEKKREEEEKKADEAAGS